MVAYATATDVADRWRPLTAAETTRADRLLESASRLIRASAPTLDTRIADEEVDPLTVADIACDMVIRVLAGGVTNGVESKAITVGGVTTSTRYASGSTAGVLYLTPGELFRLSPGIRGAFSVSLARKDS